MNGPGVVEAPSRLVDGFQRGWHRTGGATPAGEPLYSTWPRTPSIPAGDLTLNRLHRERCPLRPVITLPVGGREALTAALRAAGKQMAACVCAALYLLARHCMHADGVDERMVAGRPGSWESARLTWVAWEIGSVISDRRADPARVLQIEDILQGWIFHPDRYIEVAENLAAAAGPVIDAAGGWGQVADRWLRQMPQHPDLYSYLASRAVSFDPDAYPDTR